MREALPEEKKDLAEGFVRDGFYSHYFSQPIRLLFVGRESRGLAECNYPEVLHDAYHGSKRIGNQALNANKFNSRLIYIAWDILHGNLEWKDIPYATEIGDTSADDEGISLAFMNLSKFSNETDTWHSTALSKEDIHQLYDPICETIEASSNDGWLKPKLTFCSKMERPPGGVYSRPFSGFRLIFVVGDKN